MTAVKWDDVQHLFEDMVSVLLSTLNPDARRIDGSGGDGGRDVQIKTETELHIYECKSFTGRLTKSRRAQIKNSLETALAHQPDRWTLVVPIDHTPGELQWFESLEREYEACPLDWLGKDWLDRQMMTHPALKRYFVDGVNDEVIKLIKELNFEQTGLDGNLEDGIKRIKDLSTRLNEIDPYYRIDFSIVDGEVSVSHHPKWKGAEEERPITFGLRFEFPDTDIGNRAKDDFRHKIERGDEIVMPGTYVTVNSVSGPVGMVADLEGSSAEIKIGSSRARIEKKIRARFIVSDAEGKRKSTIPVTFEERQLGRRYGTLYGHDNTNSILLSTEIDSAVDEEGRVSGKISFTFQPQEGLSPHDLLALLKFGQNLCSPNFMTLEFDGVRPLSDPIALNGTSPVPDILVETVENLARIQSKSNTHFATPVVFSRQQLEEIRTAIHLLDGGEFELSDSPRFTAKCDRVDSVDESAPEIREGAQFSIQLSAYHPRMICGEEVYLGTGIYFCKRVEVDNSPEILAIAAGESEADQFSVVFVPVEGESTYYRLLRNDDPEELRSVDAIVLDDPIVKP